MTMQVLLHQHLDDSLTLQWKDSNVSLHMVVEKFPSEYNKTFLAIETFVFSIQFLQNSLQYTTNNFPTTTWVELNS